uniref:Uncharacterized protein n=1 Tax=Trichonephila clavipes TaxID=2585209 RepID=A0A8X6RFQ7_TRICX|nr:hypothetical protein TNCV_72881 [Trichonephila clavipes]
MDSYLACHEFEPRTAEEPPCRWGQTKLFMLRLKSISVDVKVRREGASSGTVLVTLQWFNHRSLAMREKCGNRFAPGPNYMVDAIKLLNQAPRVPDQSLASNGPDVDSRDLNFVFGHMEATPNK